MKTGISSSIRLNLLMSSLLIAYTSCSKSAEEMCEAQMNFYDQAKPNQNSEYFDTAFKSRDAYLCSWRECVKK